MGGIAYVNGAYLPANRAVVSIYDHGFLYGDGIFESMVATGEAVFKLDAHLDRFSSSAAALRLRLALSQSELADAVRETVRRNALARSYVRLVASRGPGYPSLDPRGAAEPTLAILVHARTGAAPRRDEGGPAMPRAIAVILASTRRTPSECLDAQIKACNYLNHIMARFEAIDASVDDAILLDIHGHVAEATASNVFAVRGGTIATPPPGSALAGITRAVTLDTARGLGYPVAERDLTPYDLFTADEVFLTATFGGLTPVGRVSGRVIGEGTPGPTTLRLREAVHALRDDPDATADGARP